MTNNIAARFIETKGFYFTTSRGCPERIDGWVGSRRSRAASRWRKTLVNLRSWSMPGGSAGEAAGRQWVPVVPVTYRKWAASSRYSVTRWLFFLLQRWLTPDIRGRFDNGGDRRLSTTAAVFLSASVTDHFLASTR